MSSAGRPTGKGRWWLWSPLLALAAWLAFFGEKSPSDGAAASVPARTVVATPRPAATAATPARRGAAEQPLDRLIPRDQVVQPEAVAAAGASPPRDPFSARSWTPPPPPPAPVQAAAPVAPPLPYGFIGKKQEAERWEVFLARGEQTFIAREGEVLEGTYRVDRIDPPALTFTYLPLGQVQTLPIGESR
ncbi:MAG TPA: hypothetical protein VIL30_08770 [Ramlibacter sp.]